MIATKFDFVLLSERTRKARDESERKRRAEEIARRVSCDWCFLFPKMGGISFVLIPSERLADVLLLLILSFRRQKLRESCCLKA